MSEPREPSFEDDFDCDTEPPEQVGGFNLMDVAIVRGHAYAQEYNKWTGTIEDKPNYHALKEGYVHGFLAGFAHKMGGGHD